MEIAGHAQILCMTRIHAEFERVVPESVRHIADPLKLVFLFIERTIALINRKRIAKCKGGAAQLIDSNRRHSRAEGVIQIQSGYSGILGGRGAQTVWINEHPVTEESETSISHPIVVDDVSSPISQALIAQRRSSREIGIRKLISSGKRSICSGSAQFNAKKTVT